jgi:hypothetical protein
MNRIISALSFSSSSEISGQASGEPDPEKRIIVNFKIKIKWQDLAEYK